MECGILTLLFLSTPPSETFKGKDARAVEVRRARETASRDRKVEEGPIERVKGPFDLLRPVARGLTFPSFDDHRSRVKKSWARFFDAQRADGPEDIFVVPNPSFSRKALGALF